MLKDIKSITISGGAFDRPTQLNNIFSNRLNLVYGKNGAGKSTLAGAVSSIAGKAASNGITASFNVALTDVEKQEIYVFNEAFVRDNILVAKKGPANIVMIGSSNVELSTKISELESQKDQQNEEKENKKDAIDNAKTEMESSYGALGAALKESDYSERALKLANLGGKKQTRISITENRIKDVVDAPSSAQDYSLPAEEGKLIARFNEIMPVLESGSGEMQKVLWQKPQIMLGKRPEEINALLEKIVLKPELTEREERIFALLNEQERKEYWMRSKRDIVEKKTEFCPLCHQVVTPEVRESLEETIRRLLNEESNKFDWELQNALMSWAEIQFNSPALPAETYAGDILKLEKAVGVLNGLILDAANALSRRRANMYIPEAFRLDILAWTNAVTAVNHAADVVLEDVKKYNDDIDNSSRLEKEAKSINNYLAYLENWELCKKYKEAKAVVDAGDDALKEFDKAIREIESNIRDCGSQMNQTSTACKYINAQLANIFYAEDRLRLEPGDGGEYVLYCRGKAVSPEKVSTGERNIIALTYFFATLFQNKTEAGKYSSARLIVIDDPVSSFDYGNRSGIVSFMRAEISKILQGNPDSKVLVMSHEINTITDLFRSLSRYIIQVGGKRLFYELQAGGNLKSFDDRGDNEYWSLLQSVYRYASSASEDEESERAIGNIMRRVIETYSTFTYQCGFKDMLDKEYVYSAILPEKQDYYRNFLGRFILDAQSHAGNYNDTLNFISSLFSREEKVQTAQDLLKFLYYVNPGHLEAYLFDYQFLAVKGWVINEKKETA